MMLAQPGGPALVNTFHIATISTSAMSSPIIVANGLGAVPSVLYSTCPSKRAGVKRTVCVTSMSEFIKVKSYVRFKRLLPARQGKSFARSNAARHLAMLATGQMRVSLCTHANPQPANGSEALLEDR